MYMQEGNFSGIDSARVYNYSLVFRDVEMEFTIGIETLESTVIISKSIIVFDKRPYVIRNHALE